MCHLWREQWGRIIQRRQSWFRKTLTQSARHQEKVNSIPVTFGGCTLEDFEPDMIWKVLPREKDFGLPVRRIILGITRVDNDEFGFPGRSRRACLSGSRRVALPFLPLWSAWNGSSRCSASARSGQSFTVGDDFVILRIIFSVGFFIEKARLRTMPFS